MENIKTFEEVTRSIKAMGAKWKENSAKDNVVNTYAGLHKSMSLLHLFLENEKRDINRRISAMSETYSTKVVEKNRQKLMAEFDEMANSMVEAAKKDIEEVTTSKRELLCNMIADAPSESQLRLLSILGMRKDLEVVELQNLVPAFFDNYNAMKVLQDVAHSNGVRIVLPVQLDVRVMYETLEVAHNFLMGASEQLLTPVSNMPIQYHAFFTTNDKEPDKIYDPKYIEIVEMFDHVPQLQEVKTDRTKLTAVEEEKIKNYFAPVENIDTSDKVEDIKVLKHVKALMEAHPEDIELFRISKYGKYVTEVELAMAGDN